MADNDGSPDLQQEADGNMQMFQDQVGEFDPNCERKIFKGKRLRDQK
jgi:hypothetical protein